MLPDAATRGTVDFDPKKKQWVISPERKAVIDKLVYIHADGTEVKISNAKITNKQIQRGKQELYLATFSYTGTVVAIPSSAGADYPFKVGQTKEYTHNVWHDGTNAGTVTYDSNPFLAALNLENGRTSARYWSNATRAARTKRVRPGVGHAQVRRWPARRPAWCPPREEPPPGEPPTRDTGGRRRSYPMSLRPSAVKVRRPGRRCRACNCPVLSDN